MIINQVVGRYICKRCSRSHVNYPARGVCADCGGDIYRRTTVKECKLPACRRTLIGGANRDYCYKHKGMSKDELRKENEKILHFREKYGIEL